MLDSLLRSLRWNLAAPLCELLQNDVLGAVAKHSRTYSSIKIRSRSLEVDHCLRTSASCNLRNCRQRAYWSAFDASESCWLVSQKVNQSTVPPCAASRSWGRSGACSELGSQVNSTGFSSCCNTTNHSQLFSSEY